MRKKTWMISGVVLAVLVVAGCLFFPQIAKAEMVEIEKGEDIDLIYHSFDGRYNTDVWDHQGSLTSDSSAKYVLKSNGYAQWFKTDQLSFGYKKLAFNYSKKAQITCETTMISFDGRHENAGAGLMIRSGLDVDSACVMLHFRPTEVMVTYRMADGKNSAQGKTLVGLDTSTMYPVTFKIVVIKGETKAHCYYKVGNGNWVEYATAPFTCGSEVYVGVSDYSQEQNHIATAKFSSFKYLVEAPEGYTIEGGGSTEQPEEKPVLLPEDLPVQSNVLMRETFTDGSLVNDNAETQNDITNPIWKGKLNSINIQTNEELTNRFANEYMMDETYYYAGNQDWTDYKTSYDVQFTKEWSEDEANTFHAFFRVTDIMQYGYQYYYVTVSLKPKTDKVVIELGTSNSNNVMTSTGNFINTDNEHNKPLATYTLAGSMEDVIGKWKNLTIESFDNQITVYWDSEKVIDYTDNGNNVKSTGCVGFGSRMAAVLIDNIEVTKMDDLLGGDYDNRIMGNWDQPEPAYLDRFKEEGAIY